MTVHRPKIFLYSSKCRPLENAAAGACPPSPPPAATDSYRPIVRFFSYSMWCRSVQLIAAEVSRHFGNGLRLKFGAKMSKWFGTEGACPPSPRCRSVRTLRYQFCGAEVSWCRSVPWPKCPAPFHPIGLCLFLPVFVAATGHGGQTLDGHIKTVPESEHWIIYADFKTLS